MKKIIIGIGTAAAVVAPIAAVVACGGSDHQQTSNEFEKTSTKTKKAIETGANKFNELLVNQQKFNLALVDLGIETTLVQADLDKIGSKDNHPQLDSLIRNFQLKYDDGVYVVLLQIYKNIPGNKEVANIKINVTPKSST